MMLSTRIKPVLHWINDNRHLTWGFFDLVSLERGERNGMPYYMLTFHNDILGGLNPEDIPEMETLWEDEENHDGDCGFYLKDNGGVHERLKEVFERILSELPYHLPVIDGDIESSAVDESEKSAGQAKQGTWIGMKLVQQCLKIFSLFFSKHEKGGRKSGLSTRK